MSTLTELITKFKFEGSQKPLTDFNAKLGSSLKLIAGMTTALAATAGVFAKWVSGVTAAIDPTVQLSRVSGVAVGTIQELGFVASVTGSSAQLLEASIGRLAERIGEANRGQGEGVKLFQFLGISIRDANGALKSTDQILLEISKRFNELSLSDAEKTSIAVKLGIDPSLVQLLSLTSKEMSGLMKRARDLGTLTKEQADAAADYNDSLTVMRYAMNAIKQQVAVGVAPAFQRLAETFTDLIANNKEWIISGIRAATKFIGDFLTMVARLTPILTALGVAFVAAKIYTLGFAGAMAILFSPVTLITGAILSLMVILDDLIVAFKGGDSVIGNFFQNTLNIDLSKTLDQLKAMWEWVVRLTNAITGSFATAWGKVTGIFGGDDKIAPNQNMLVTGGRGAGVSNTTDNRRVEQDVKIEIRTDDPIRAGNAAADSIQKQLRDANAQLGVGGM